MPPPGTSGIMPNDQKHRGGAFENPGKNLRQNRHGNRGDKAPRHLAETGQNQIDKPRNRAGKSRTENIPPPPHLKNEAKRNTTR
jgi:hypothetical protein